MRPLNLMNKNIQGLATIAELPAEYYRADGMRAASNTGLPMVIGGCIKTSRGPVSMLAWWAIARAT